MNARAVLIWVGVVIGALGVAHLHRVNAEMARDIAALEHRRDALREQAVNARRQGNTSTATAAVTTTESRTQTTPMSGAEDAETQAWLAKWAAVKRLISLHPEQAIPEMELLDVRGWLAAVRGANLESDEAARKTLAAIRDSAKQEFTNQLARALRVYLNQHNGALPLDMMTLAPYFDPVVDPAILARYTVVTPGAVAATNSTAPVILETSPVDLQYDNRAGVSAGPMATGGWAAVGGRYSGRAPWPGSPKAGK